MILSKVDLPDMSKGDWKIEKFVVDRVDWSAASHGRAVPVGETYTRLVRGKGTVVMSDTPAERLECFEAYHRAEGICLVNGLGLGMLLKNILSKTSVTEITVVEISQDLIDLVLPYYKDPRVTYVCANALEYKPRVKRYNMVWHDIWDNICSDNLEDMAILHRKYGRICDWQGSWMKDECKRMRGRW